MMNWIVPSLVTTVGLLQIFAGQVPFAPAPDRSLDQIRVDAPVGPSSVYTTGNIDLALTDLATTDSHIFVTNRGTIVDLSVRLRLDHPRLQDLELHLIAPDGTTVKLARGVGGLNADFGAANASCAGVMTTFDDHATGSVLGGAAPFFGAYRPDGRLSTFYGRGSIGDWTLRITDRASTQTGTLYCWELVLRRMTIPGDFFGNGRSDAAYWRPGTNSGTARQIESTSVTTFTLSGDAVPASAIFVPGAYSGDYWPRPAWFDPSSGQWRGTNLTTTIWGGAGDVPVPGDYDADGADDLAVWRPSNGTWYVRNQFSWAWGGTGDIPVPGDYNGDGTTDMAVWRPSTGAWFVYGGTSLTWGGAGDIPVPADYDGDGRTDFGIWRPTTGEWFIYTAAGVVQPVHTWGGNGDIPVPADYDSDLKAELAVWRPSDGTYYIRNVASVQWGQNGDVPAQKRPAYPGYPY
jgi:subtilisin-like proprotein convertase family protein